MGIGFGIGISLKASVSGGVLDALLAGAAVMPAWLWDAPFDGSLFQDRAGTTPVSAYGQSVGYIASKGSTGYPLIAPSDTARPVIGRVPKTGRRNLLTYTEDLTNVVWIKTNLAVAGTLVTRTSTVANCYAQQLKSFAADARYVAQAEVKLGSVGSLVGLRVQGTYPYRADMVLDVSSGMLVHSSGTTYTLHAATAAALGDGWYRLTLDLTATGSNVSAVVAGPAANASSAWEVAHASLLDCHVRNLQLELGSATAYQKVVSAYDVTEAGQADCNYLHFDGVDDTMSSPTITPAVDKVQIFTAVRKDHDDDVGTLFETSANSYVNNGALALFVPDSTFNAGVYDFRSKGSSVAVSAIGVGFPATAVITGLGDISGDRTILRVNGSVVSTMATDQGSGNYGAHQAFFGARMGAAAPFLGLVFAGLIPRWSATNLDAGLIAATEAWFAARTPI